MGVETLFIYISLNFERLNPKNNNNHFDPGSCKRGTHSSSIRRSTKDTEVRQQRS